MALRTIGNCHDRIHLSLEGGLRGKIWWHNFDTISKHYLPGGTRCTGSRKCRMGEFCYRAKILGGNLSKMGKKWENIFPRPLYHLTLCALGHQSSESRTNQYCPPHSPQPSSDATEGLSLLEYRSWWKSLMTPSAIDSLRLHLHDWGTCS